MNKRAFIVPVVLVVIAILTAGCGGLFVIEPMTGLDAQETPMATLTPEIPATPAPTSKPERPMGALDLTLSPWNCSSGYEVEDPADLGFEPGAPFIEDLTIASSVVLTRDDEDGGILIATTLIPDPAQRQTFDLYLNEPGAFVLAILNQLGAPDITLLSQEPMVLGEGTGDVAAGVSVTASGGQGLMRLDVVIFRRDVVGAFAMAVYPDDTGPVMLATDLAFALDDMIVESLMNAPEEPDAQVDFSGLGLALWGCPPGYQTLDPVEAGLETGTPFTAGLTVAGSFIYFNERDEALAFGLTVLISEDEQREAFNAFLAQPETFLPSFMDFIGEADFDSESYEPIVIREEIGDTASGITMIVTSDEGPGRFDVIISRRGVVGAFVVVAYLDGQVSELLVEDLAFRLDGSIAEVLAGDNVAP